MRYWLPVLGWLPAYHRGWLRQDVAAGLVLTSLLVPQGMAYATLAGLPPITGLYTTIMCLLGYVVFGPSRRLVLGPDSALGPMIAATILPIVGADGDPARAVALASMLGLLVGAFMLLAGLLKAGLVADLLSRPTQIGYMNGLAVVIFISQLPKLFGFSVDADDLLEEAQEFVLGVADGETVVPALLVGLGALAVIAAFRRWLPRYPGILVAVVLSLVVSAVLDLAGRGVAVVGELPQGLPPLTWPGVPLADVALLLAGALSITIVALTDTISTATAFGRRDGHQVDGNREMVGIGAANVLAGLFQGFPVSTSSSRTAVARQVGSRTQVTGLVGAGTILLLLVLAPGLLADLPQSVLAAVVIIASVSLLDLAATRRLWVQRRTEFTLSLVAFLGVAAFGVLAGVAVAVGLSILNVFRRAWWPYMTILGRVPDLAGYHDVRSYPHAAHLPGVVIFRFDAPLFFANARTFREQLEAIAAQDPKPQWIIVASEPITDVDTTAADMLEELDGDLDEQGIALVFAEMKDPVRTKLERYGLARHIEDQHFFPTLTAALKAFRAATGAGWEPPEDLPEDVADRLDAPQDPPPAPRPAPPPPRPPPERQAPAKAGRKRSRRR